MSENISTNDYPVMYRTLRQSFLTMKCKMADLELSNSRLRTTLYNIKSDTTDNQTRMDATMALRADGLGDLD